MSLCEINPKEWIIFKPWPNDENYLIGADGRVFSKRRGRFLECSWGGSGYLRCNLNGVCEYVHRLVLSTFSPTERDDVECNHIDEDKTNNNIRNLEWMTHRDNCNYGTRNERISATWRAKRENKAVNQEDIAIKNNQGGNQE